MNRKIIYSILAVISLTLLGLALNSWHIGRLDNFVRIKIEEFSKKNLPFDVLPGKTEIQLLPFNVRINDIKIIPKAELAQKIKALEIEQIKLSPSFFHLFIGKMHLSYLNASGVQIHLKAPLDENGEEININLNKILRSIPISQIKLERINLNLLLTDKEKSYTITAKDISSTITNDLTSVAVKLKVPVVTASVGKQVFLKEAQLQTSLFLTNKNLILSDLKIKEGSSFIIASGSTQHQLNKNLLKTANINLRTQIEALRVKEAYEFFRAEGETNPLNGLLGLLRADIQLFSNQPKQISATIQSDIHNLSYDNFKIGDVGLIAELESEKQEVHLTKGQLTTPGITGEILNLRLNLKELAFSEAKVNISKFELHQFLVYALGINVPASGNASGSFSCSGSFKNFNITCPGSLEAHDMIVTTPSKKDLVAMKKIAAEGSVTVNDKEVSYKAQLKSDISKGSSQGVINYKTGFNIEFEGNDIDLDDVKKVSVLEVAGTGHIKGSTKGDAHSAVFDFDFEGKNIRLQKYKLGEISLNLAYKAGMLHATKVQGTLDSSRYLGMINVDLDRNWIDGKVQFPFIDLAVAKDAIKEHINIPVDVAGSGSAILNIDGPLDPDKLSFTTKARLYNCRLAQQHFDTADVDLTSDLGKVNFNSLVLEEKNSNLNFSGFIDLADKSYHLIFKTQRYYLDDFEYVKIYNAPAKGLFTLEGRINGKFSSPGVEGKFSSSNFNLSGETLAPINGDMAINTSKTIINVVGPNELKMTFKDLQSSPDIHIDANTQNINLAPMVTSLLGIDQIDDYRILASTSISLRINKKDTNKINGYVYIPTLSLQFQKNEIRNEKEISFFFTNGKVNFSPFLLTGKNSKLEFKSSSNSISPIDVQISGLFSLSYLQIFAPFLETLEGLTSVNLRMRGDASKLHFIGSSFIEDGFIKLPDIQHSVEDVKVDVLFNQDQIIINSIKGRFASGQLLGDGKILIKGKKDFPLNLNLHLDNIDLNLPAQVNTKGNAELQLTGNWMPFTLSGTYSVADGLITKELSGGEASAASPHQAFLPNVLRDDNSSPILLDLTVNPTVPMKVKNSLVDGKMDGRIKIAGTPQAPILGGNVALTKNSQIIFMDVIFKVRDSNFVFGNTSPPNPSIYLIAETRYRGYDIEVLAQGTAEKPRFKWSSSPSLTEPEIISLLTLGTTTSQQIASIGSTTNANTNATGSTSASSTGVGLQNSQQSGAAIFSGNPLSKELKNRFGFDIQFSSKFDTANSVAVPKISAAKQINEKTSLIGSYQTGRDTRSDLTLRYQLSKDFSTSMNMQSQRQEEANQQRGNNFQRNDILGIDIEFRKEFK